MGSTCRGCLLVLTFLVIGCSSSPRGDGSAMLQDRDAVGKPAVTRPVDRGQGVTQLPAEAPPAMAGEAGGPIGMESDRQPPAAMRSSASTASIATDRPQPIPAEERVSLGRR